MYFFTAKLEEYDLEKIKIINEQDKGFKVEIIDLSNIIVERKFSDFWLCFSCNNKQQYNEAIILQ